MAAHGQWGCSAHRVSLAGEFLPPFRSPVTASVCDALAEVLDAQSDTGRRTLAWPGDAGAITQDALPLRLAGGVHALHRAGQAPDLAPIYAGTATAEQAAQAVAAAVAAHDAVLTRWLDGPPQTNETGRAAVFMAGLTALAAEWPDTDFDLLEIGSSAGLNLMLARFGYDLGGRRIGPDDAGIRLAPEWRGPPPPDAPVRIARVCGVDVQPIDLTVPGEADRLLAYVWPDQDGGTRLARAELAGAMARADPPALERGDAADWLEQRLAEPQAAGRARIVLHSIVWPYLPSATRARISASVGAAIAQATPERRIAWLAYEWPDDGSRTHELRLKNWFGPQQDRVLARAHPHGSWIEWEAGPGA